MEIQILDTIEILQTISQFTHVQGQKDDDIQFKDLLWPSKLNVYCDQLATSELISINKPSGAISMLPTIKLCLLFNNIAIAHHIPSQIRITWIKLVRNKYLTKHYHWGPHIFAQIDWKLFRNTLDKFSFAKQKFLTKWINKILPLNQQHFEYKMVTTAFTSS